MSNSEFGPRLPELASAEGVVGVNWGRGGECVVSYVDRIDTYSPDGSLAQSTPRGGHLQDHRDYRIQDRF